MARGGLQPFFQWLADHSAYGSSDSQVLLTYKHDITPGLAMGMEAFIKGIPLLKSRIYNLGAVRQLPVVIYSDAEWTVVDEPPWLRKGLGGITWDRSSVHVLPWIPQCTSSTPWAPEWRRSFRWSLWLRQGCRKHTVNSYAAAT